MEDPKTVPERYLGRQRPVAPSPAEDAVHAVVDWLESRLNLGGRLEQIVYKPVPLHRWSVVYLAGGACLFLFLAQLITGLLMVLYYQPTPSAAHDSLRRMMGIPFGWLVRSLHVWGAAAFLLGLLAHFSTTFACRAYRSPRQLTWMTGFTLLVLALVFHATGSLLAWSTPEPARTAVISAATAVAATMDPELADQLTRTYLTHVLALPLCAALLIAIHLALVGRHNMSVPPDEIPWRDLPFFPLVVLLDQCIWALVAAALLVLASLRPATLAGGGENFLFAFWHALRRAAVGAAGPGAAWGVDGLLVALAVSWVTLPLWDRMPARRGWPARVLGLVTGSLLLGAVIRPLVP